MVGARRRTRIVLEDFNRGDHVGALADRVRLEAISRVLYPSDDTPAGHELRLRQEIFFASASLQDLLRRHTAQHGELSSLPDHVAIQLNDTHPAIAIAELMRLLVDEHGMPWDLAWRITTAVFNYTNHTLLPEALEKWPVPLMEGLLPRHMQIIYLLNALHLETPARAPATPTRSCVASLSLIEENHARQVRMGNLAFLGLAARERRLGAAHGAHEEDRVPRLPRALSRSASSTRPTASPSAAGSSRPTRASRPSSPRRSAREFRDDTDAHRGPRAASPTTRPSAPASPRCGAPTRSLLARIVAERTGASVDPEALFDVQIKRIHEYKRQLLNLLETIALYNEMRAHPARDWVPRVKIFAGKAAAGYQQAKLIIKLANDVARVVNDDPALRGLLKVVFLPNYNVSLAESIIPAADLSEQISTAGMEASGTGNMKLALNGALTIGTLDGANIEILERVGAENIFIFGLTAAEVDAAPRRGHRRDGRHRRLAGARRGARRCSSPASSRPTTAAATRASSTTCATTTTSWSAPTSRPTARRSARWPTSGATATPGGAAPSSTPRAWAGSRRTAPSSSTRARSGAPSPGPAAKG